MAHCTADTQTVSVCDSSILGRTNKRFSEEVWGRHKWLSVCVMCRVEKRRQGVRAFTMGPRLTFLDVLLLYKMSSSVRAALRSDHCCQTWLCLLMVSKQRAGAEWDGKLAGNWNSYIDIAVDLPSLTWPTKPTTSHHRLSVFEIHLSEGGGMDRSNSVLERRKRRRARRKKTSGREENVLIFISTSTSKRLLSVLTKDLGCLVCCRAPSKSFGGSHFTRRRIKAELGVRFSTLTSSTARTGGPPQKRQNKAKGNGVGVRVVGIAKILETEGFRRCFCIPGSLLDERSSCDDIARGAWKEAETLSNHGCDADEWQKEEGPNNGEVRLGNESGDRKIFEGKKKKIRWGGSSFVFLFVEKVFVASSLFGFHFLHFKSLEKWSSVYLFCSFFFNRKRIQGSD